MGESLRRIGKYQLIEQIGVGGFGEVFKGFDPYIKRPVAIKTCNSKSDDIRSRFFKEAEIAGNLHHRNVTTVYDFGVEGELPYLIQEYLSGEDLDAKIKRRDFLPYAEKLLYLIQIARGLAYAHEQGVIHRDIKPANVRVLDDGTTKIMDFGIAKLAQQETGLTQTGMTLGTAAYLSPEQIRGLSVDCRSDIFSFGVLAYELLTYQRPFQADQISAVLYQLLNQEPRPLADLWPAAPREAAELVRRCLAKHPDGRPADGAALLAELEKVQQVSRERSDVYGQPENGAVDGPTIPLDSGPLLARQDSGPVGAGANPGGATRQPLPRRAGGSFFADREPAGLPSAGSARRAGGAGSMAVDSMTGDSMTGDSMTGDTGMGDTGMGGSPAWAQASGQGGLGELELTATASHPRQPGRASTAAAPPPVTSTSGSFAVATRSSSRMPLWLALAVLLLGAAGAGWWFGLDRGQDGAAESASLEAGPGAPGPASGNAPGAASVDLPAPAAGSEQPAAAANIGAANIGAAGNGAADIGAADIGAGDIGAGDIGAAIETPPAPTRGRLLIRRPAWTRHMTVRLGNGAERALDRERSFDLEPGRHTLTFTLDHEGFQARVPITVDLEAGNDKWINAPIAQPGVLTVRPFPRRPQGQVRLDGDDLGSSPVRRKQVSPGRHVIEIRPRGGEGSGSSQLIEVASGQETIVTFDLEAGRISTAVKQAG